MSHLGDGLEMLCRRTIAENERLRSNAEYAGQVLTSTADDMLNNALAIAQERDALEVRVAELEAETRSAVAVLTHVFERDLCERHADEVRAESFGTFYARVKAAGCSRCHREETARLRAERDALHELREAEQAVRDSFGTRHADGPTMLAAGHAVYRRRQAAEAAAEPYIAAWRAAREQRSGAAS